MTTKDKILRAALYCARKHGLYDMTRTQVAKQASTATGTVSFHFGNMRGLQNAVIKHTISSGKFLDVLVQAMGRRDPAAQRVPAEIKRAALDTLLA